MIPWTSIGKYALVAALVLGPIAGGVYWHTSTVNKAVSTAVSAETTRVEGIWDKKLLKANEARRTLESDLRKDKDKGQEDDKKKIANLNATVTSLNARLSGFASKGSSNSSDSGDRSASVGETTEGETRILYRETIEDLAAEARRADEVVIALEGCYRDYDTVRNRIGKPLERPTSDLKE